jgi:hypothetical protein
MFLMLIRFFDRLRAAFCAYKILKSSRTKSEKGKHIEIFERSLDMLGHPMYREIFGKSEDLYMFSKDMRHFMRRYLDRYYQKAME